MSAKVEGSGTPGDPWTLQTPSLQGEFQMVRDPDTRTLTEAGLLL